MQNFQLTELPSHHPILMFQGHLFLAENWAPMCPTALQVGSEKVPV
jgi:hypothetical protein